MKYTILLFLISIGLTAQSQPREHACSIAKMRKSTADKSASLSPAQIAKTEWYDVHHYRLNLTLDNLSTQIAGTVDMHAKARVAIDSVWFELFESLDITGIKLNGNPVSFSRSGSAVKVLANLSQGVNFVVSTDYSGIPPEAGSNPFGGSGMTNATSPTWGNQVTWSLSQPFSAYEWWPCKQSLKDKIDSLDVSVTVPSNCKAGSNGVLQQVVNLGNNKSRYDWKHRHTIDYYLVSVAVAEYIDYTIFAHPAGATDSIRIQNYIYNNPATLQNFKADIDETAAFLEFFTTIFGPYPFANEKYGHCMAPLGGGMEHQTMTTQGTFNQTLTAHELAHQWFGNYVTCGSWADIWVNEGFASYSEYLMLEALYPGQQLADMLQVHNDVMSQPGGSVWCPDSLASDRIFSGRLTYNKGSAIIHTIRSVVENDALFFLGMRNYLANFAKKTAIGTDFQHIMEQTTGKDLSALFEQWYFGEGYPTYTARWNMVGNDLHLRITHTASRPAATPTFTTPLDIRFKRNGLPDTTIRFAIPSNSVGYILPAIGTITSIVSVDPQNWIVNKTGLTSRDVNLNLTGLAVSEAEKPMVQIAPNPASDVVLITGTPGKSYSLSVFSPNGKEIMAMPIIGSATINTMGFASGIYLFRLQETGGETRTVKLIRK